MTVSVPLLPTDSRITQVRKIAVLQEAAELLKAGQLDSLERAVSLLLAQRKSRPKLRRVG